MAYKHNTRTRSVTFDKQILTHTYLDSMDDLGRAYSYAVDPTNDHKCVVTTTYKGEDYRCCISDNVDNMRKYYKNGICSGNLIISENILDHAITNDAPKCLMLLTEIGIRPTERSLELAAIYGHINVMNVITTLGIPITQDIADISAQHGRIEILKHIYLFDAITPSTYGLINSISNKHCVVVDFICKLLRKYGKSKSSRESKDARKLTRKHGRRNITPLQPINITITRLQSQDDQISAPNPGCEFPHGSSAATSRSRSNTNNSLSSMISDSFSDFDSSSLLSSLSSLGSLSSLNSLNSMSPLSSPRSPGSVSLVGTPRCASPISDTDSPLTSPRDDYDEPLTPTLLSPLSSPPTSPRSTHSCVTETKPMLSPEITRSRSNSFVSTYSIPSQASRDRSSKLSMRKSKLPKITLENLQCNVDSIEAACSTGCNHCFEKVIKYNTEFKPKCENTVPLLRRALLIASAKGNLEICKKLVKMGAELTKQVFVAAAKSNNLDLFIWLHEVGCPWSYEVYDTAMTYGHLELGKYALENGCGA